MCLLRNFWSFKISCNLILHRFVAYPYFLKKAVPLNILRSSRLVLEAFQSFSKRRDEIDFFYFIFSYILYSVSWLLWVLLIENCSTLLNLSCSIKPLKAFKVACKCLFGEIVMMVYQLHWKEIRVPRQQNWLICITTEIGN